ncbi:hypothetical protein AAG906_004097 [Vitis piasezkii]
MTCGTRFGIVKWGAQNWARFVLQYVEDGIRDYYTSHPTYIRGCVFPLHFRLHGQMSKSRGAWFQIHTYGNYGHVRYAKIQQLHKQSKPSAHNDGHPYEVGCSHSDDPTETIEARLSRNSEHLMSLASSVAQDIATLCARSSGGQSGCALTPPQEAVNVERKKDEGSTGVHPCSDEMMRKGSDAASTHSGQQKVTDAAVDDGPCIDHDTFPPSQMSAELQSLKGVQIGVQEGFGSKEPSPTPRRRVKHTAKMLIIGLVCRMMNVEQAIPPRAHYFDPSFSVVLASLTPKAKKHEIKERCRMFLHAEFVGHDFSSCDMLFFPVCYNNHWHMHVVNIPASRVEILSSLPLRRDMIVACSQSSTWNIGTGDTSTFNHGGQDASISIEVGRYFGY